MTAKELTKAVQRTKAPEIEVGDEVEVIRTKVRGFVIKALPFIGKIHITQPSQSKAGTAIIQTYTLEEVILIAKQCKLDV